MLTADYQEFANRPIVECPEHSVIWTSRATPREGKSNQNTKIVNAASPGQTPVWRRSGALRFGTSLFTGRARRPQPARRVAESGRSTRQTEKYQVSKIRDSL